MGAEKKSWDDTPALGDPRTGWNFQPGSPDGKRDSRRLASKELTQVLGVPCIAIKIATVRKVSKNLPGYPCGIRLPDLDAEARFNIQVPHASMTLTVAASQKNTNWLAKVFT